MKKKKKTIISDSETTHNSLCRNLPPEIVADILSRLPVKSLCQFKCVSPSWNSLISSPYFAKTHLKKRTNINNPQNVILISSYHVLYSVDFAKANPTAKKLDFPSVPHCQKWVEVLGYCNGLFLVSDGNFKFLFNPTTGERKKLPTSPSFTLNLVRGPYIYVYGFGYDLSTDDYKIVMLCYQYIKSDSKYYCDGDANVTSVVVYSLKTDTWRRIQDSHYRPLGFTFGVHFNERIHWLCGRTGRSDGSKVIVAFDLLDEIFREVQLPTSFCDYKILYHRMVVLGGCLGVFVCAASCQREVWMMKDYGVRESWTKFTMDLMMPSVHFLCLLAEDELLLKTEGRRREGLYGDKLVVYNPKKKTMRDMVVRGIPPTFEYGGGTYVESLISPNHGGGIGRQ